MKIITPTEIDQVAWEGALAPLGAAFKDPVPLPRVTIGEPLARQAIAEGVASPDADFDSIIYFLESLNLGLLVQRGAGQLPPDPEAWTRFLARVMRSMGRTTAKTDRPPDQT